MYIITENCPDYRNPFIAEAMKVLGYVNRFSRGVYRVQKELMENGNGEAIFDFSLITAFRVIEKASEKYFELGFGVEESSQNFSMGNAGEIENKSSKKSSKKSSEKILTAIIANSNITIQELVDSIGLSSAGIRKNLDKLKNQGKIRRVGPDKGGHWEIIE